MSQKRKKEKKSPLFLHSSKQHRGPSVVFCLVGWFLFLYFGHSVERLMLKQRQNGAFLNFFFLSRSLEYSSAILLQAKL